VIVGDDRALALTAARREPILARPAQATRAHRRLGQPRRHPRTLNAFERDCNEVAEPFEWNFDRADLAALTERLTARERLLGSAA
jgi:hypothetical protein